MSSLDAILTHKVNAKLTHKVNAIPRGSEPLQW